MNQSHITPNKEAVSPTRVRILLIFVKRLLRVRTYLQDLTTTPQELFTLLTYNSSCNMDNVNWESLKQAFYLAGCKEPEAKRQRM